MVYIFKLSFFLLDVIACVSPIGIFFGRIANFINAELVGKVTTVSWGVIFPTVDALPRHPSQLYEAILEGIFLPTKQVALQSHGWNLTVWEVVFGPPPGRSFFCFLQVNLHFHSFPWLMCFMR